MIDGPHAKFPPDGPSRKAVWLLILAVLLMLLANVIHQGVL